MSATTASQRAKAAVWPRAGGVVRVGEVVRAGEDVRVRGVYAMAMAMACCGIVAGKVAVRALWQGAVATLMLGSADGASRGSVGQQAEAQQQQGENGCRREPHGLQARGQADGFCPAAGARGAASGTGQE